MRAGAPSDRGVPRRERGFALLLVLWSMALLALLGAHVVATGRAELQLAGNLRGAAAAEAAADGAVHAAIFHLLDASPQRWLPDGMAREMALPGGALAVVRVESEQGKVNPNLASLPLMRALPSTRSTVTPSSAMTMWSRGMPVSAPSSALARR